MSRDPYDVLKQQLVEAVDGRSRRRFGYRTRLLAAVAALAAGGGVAVAAGLLGGPAEKDRVNAAIGAGYSAASKDPACTPPPVQQARKPRPIADPVPQWIRQKLGIFRRPARPGDQVPRRLLSISAEELLTKSVRVARAPDGSRRLLYLSRGVFLRGPYRDPVACIRAARDAALAYLDDGEASERNEVRGIMDGRIRAQQKMVLGRTRFTLTVLGLTSNGRLSGGGATILTETRRIPAMGSIGSGYYSGLVPDEVVRMRLLDASGSPRAKPLDVAVRDNFFSLRLPDRMGNKMIMEWINARGRVIRRTHPRF